MFDLKKAIFSFFTVMLSVLLMLISAEVMARAYIFLKSISGSNVPSFSVVDDKLGWRTRENHIFNGHKKNASGEEYKVKYKTNEYGFKAFGELTPRKGRKKVLFIGDSFTHAREVSNGRAYYDLLGESIGVEIFAYGCGGYGTLQEYMIIDEYIDMIDPDCVVLQYCSNDFINNSYELELRSYWNNNGLTRPYLMENGDIVYALPKKGAAIRQIANKYSKFLYYIICKLDRFFEKDKVKGSVEKIIRKRGREFDLFDKSVLITERLIKMIIRRVPPDIKIYAFSCDWNENFCREFKRISEENGIIFIDGVPQAVCKAKNEGLVTTVLDKAHWN